MVLIDVVLLAESDKCLISTDLLDILVIKKRSSWATQLHNLKTYLMIRLRLLTQKLRDLLKKPKLKQGK